LGVRTQFKLGGKGNTLVTFGEGDVEPPLGAHGGLPGTLNKMEITYPDGRVYKPTTKDLIKDVPAGTIYYQQAGGGGGLGNPKKRDRKLVAKDLRNGKISKQSAQKDYGLSL
jgi:N-methylhydantoinase B